ncbi:MAG: autotransporter assembly complex family protein, partial [Thiotrichaceae bacterium]
MSSINSIIPLITTFLLWQGSGLAYAEDVEKKPNKSSNKSVETKLTHIELLGVNDEILKKNITARLPAFKPECDADKETLERYKRTVVKKVDKATRALGYYRSNASFKTRKVNGCWLVEAHVHTGAPVIVIKQDINITGEGRNNKTFKELPLPYTINKPLNHLKYSDYKSSLVEAAQENGYLAAKFSTKEILVNLKKNTATVTLSFDTGKRFRYGNILVEQEVLGDKYINRYTLLKKNDFFSSTKLIEQQQLLQSSGYYSSVSVQADYDNAKQAIIPIKITLTEKKRNHYRLALGFGSDTGFRAKASLDRRWTGPKGHKLNISLGLSQRVNEITTQLLVPKNDPEKNNLLYSISIKQDDNDDVRSENIKIGVASTSFVKGDWQRNLSLTHLSDKTRVEGKSANKSSLTLLGIQYAKAKAENRIFPKKGWRLRFEAEGAIDKLLSDTTVLQLQAHGKYITKIGKGRLLLRADLGTTFGDGLDDLPKDLRFFAGGTNSLRGFGYESLGELNNEGKVIGGKKLIEVSMEYEYPVYDKWAIAGFVDAGNAFDSLSRSEIKVGVGVGARWSSPIGPVRLDFGVPSDDV